MAYLRYFVLDLVRPHVLVLQGVVEVPEHCLLAHGAVQGLHYNIVKLITQILN